LEIIKNKKFIILAVIILCVVLLSGCRNDAESDGGYFFCVDEGYFYEAEVIAFPELPAGYEGVSNITQTGDIIYFTASVNELSSSDATISFKSVAIFSMDLDGTNLRQLPAYSPQLTPPPEASGDGLFIYAMQADADGNIWLIEAERYYIFEEPDIFRDIGNTFTIRKLDNDGKELLSADISDLAVRFDGFYISMFTIDDNGFIYIGCSYILETEATIHIMDSEFNTLFTLEAPAIHHHFIRTSDGSVAFIMERNNVKYLQKIDIDKKALGSSVHLPENFSIAYSGYNDFLIIYMDSAALYGISGDFGEVVRILDWIDTGIMPNGLGNISFLHDGRIFLTKSTPVPGSINFKHEIIFLTKTESINIAQTEKTELTLGTLHINPSMQKAILDFNNSSTTHYISVINYSSNTTPNDTEGAFLRFITEVSAGKVPDILILAGIPIERLIALDLLVDLYPYLDSDSELSRDNLMESVLKAQEINDKLFMINQAFRVLTIVGNPSVLGEYPGWTMDEFMAVLDANPQADFPFGTGQTKQSFLIFRVLMMNLYEYIDIGSRTADFNNSDFIELLNFINTFPSETDDSIYDPLLNRELKAEGHQIMDSFNVRVQDLKTQQESFGGEIVFKGLPTADRSGHSFIIEDAVAITTSAADKDGAWDFVRTLLMEEKQREQEFFFPMNKAVFNERMQKDMEPYSFMQNGREIKVEPTQEDVDEIVALINSTTKITGHGSAFALANIISESAEDFFNGLISAEDAARIIQNRVTIYLAEQE